MQTVRAGLGGVQSSDLRAFGQVFNQPVSVAFGERVSLERCHLPFPGHIPADAVRIAPFAFAVNHGEHLATVFDALWKLHICAFDFSRFLCQNCV